MIDPRSSMPNPDHDNLFSNLTISDQAKADLERRMKEPSRHYHTRHHLDVLWSRHRCYGEAEGLDPSLQRLIALAIAYHDAVYIGGSADNEEASATLWLDVSATACSLNDRDRHWVAETIRATGDHLGAAREFERTDARAHARQWVIDLDLTPLGEAPDVFDENMGLLAAEVPHFSERQKKASLIAALRHFATAQPLYRCPSLAATFEEAAQLNLRRHVSQQDDNT